MRKNYFLFILSFCFVLGILVISLVLAANNFNSDYKFNVVVKYKENSKLHSFEDRTKNLQVTKKEYDELLSSKDIEAVKINKRVSAFLQNSVSIINASKTWGLQLNGINLSGIEQSVCIIDTGINYSHSDLQGSFLTGYCYCDWDGLDGTSLGCCPNDLNEDTNVYDDEGHGTHVSGIVAANGATPGVSPGVKIVMIKALDFDGLGWNSDIVKGIDWCVANSIAFNISVISMSLGDATNYTDYCDSYVDNLDFSRSINAAVAKNISVVIAAGNSKNYTGISSPACIQNATPVGATDKSDAIAAYSNRNFLVKLFAPGTSINATYLSSYASSGYDILSGTSMATPHVAGAIAIMNQYLKISGKTKTPRQLESILNSTGKSITDSGSSNLVYSRIDLYNAILKLDSPVISLVFPANATSSSDRNQTFRCNVTDFQISNVTFYLWNSSNSVVNITSYNLTGSYNQTEINITNLTQGTYSWNCLGCDNSSNCELAAANFTRTIDLSLNSINVSVPLNNSWQNGLRFNVSIGESGNCWVRFNNTNISLINSSSTMTQFYYFNSTIYETDANNSFNVTFFCNDSLNNINSSSIFFFGVEKIFPNVSLISPDNAYSTTSTGITFSYNVTELNSIASCSLILNGIIDSTNSTITNLSATHSFTKTLSAASYSWGINCTDSAGNIANSSLRSLTIESPPVPASSGGGGGGGGSSAASTFYPSQNQIFSGYSPELKKDDSVRFSSFSGENHSVKVNKIEAASTEITVASNPFNVTLYVGIEKKINLSSVDYYDLSLKLNSVANNKANVTIKVINELIPKPILNGTRQLHENETIQDSSPDKNKSGFNLANNKLYIAGIVVLIVIVIVFVLIKTKKNKVAINKKKKI